MIHPPDNRGIFFCKKSKKGLYFIYKCGIILVGEILRFEIKGGQENGKEIDGLLHRT